MVAELLKKSGLENVALLETEGNPVVYGDWLHAQGKPTVLIYGHYDVQPVDPLELWDTPPFEPDIRDGKLYARGASDNKGQIFLHIKAVEAYLETKGSLPVNIKFCIEGEEEIGSPHLPLLLEKNREKFASDLLVISDTAMLGENKPAICYGLRGLITFELKVTGAKKDLPSGLYGGAVQNPVHAIAKILGSMHNEDGKVAIDGFYDDVQESSEEEKAAILSLQHDDQQLCKILGIAELYGEKGYTTLERMWTRPTLEINGIHSGYSKAGFKTIIPSEAIAQITCRLVPDQNPLEICKNMEKHVRKYTPQGVTSSLVMKEYALPYVTPIHHKAIQAAAKAYQHAYDTKVAFIRAGGSIPIVETFSNLYHIPVVLMGFGLPEANVHAPNEYFCLNNFDKGLRTLLCYWNELGNIY
ncbi:dipeptidase [Brevibacillus sp. GCM10020057]|uniref:dipeptidase n=1 Tax=Brevibacillus sp. GCM10020057 TaxID=3317327 RepID=UPI00362A2930